MMNDGADLTKQISKVFIREVIVGLALLALVLSPTGLNAAETQSAQGQAHQESDSAVRWGVRILHLHLTADNQLLDLRFQVLDTEKARPILDRNLKAYLVNQKTGKTFSVPITKSGAMRQSTLKPEKGREYFIWFSNPRALTKAGDVMTLAVGKDIRIKDITVEKSPPPLDAKARESIQLDKVGQWQKVRKKMRQAHDTCVEQCKDDPACRDTCDTRLADQEKQAYERLVYGKE